MDWKSQVHTKKIQAYSHLEAAYCRGMTDVLHRTCVHPVSSILSSVVSNKRQVIMTGMIQFNQMHKTNGKNT